LKQPSFIAEKILGCVENQHEDATLFFFLQVRMCLLYHQFVNLIWFSYIVVIS